MNIMPPRSPVITPTGSSCGYMISRAMISQVSIVALPSNIPDGNDMR